MFSYYWSRIKNVSYVIVKLYLVCQLNVLRENWLHFSKIQEFQCWMHILIIFFVRNLEKNLPIYEMNCFRMSTQCNDRNIYKVTLIFFIPYLNIKKITPAAKKCFPCLSHFKEIIRCYQSFISSLFQLHVMLKIIKNSTPEKL